MPTDLLLRIWQLLEIVRPGDRLRWAFDIGILTLILLNVVAVVAGTLETVQAQAGSFLEVFEVFSVAVFTIEYALRLWSCVAARQLGRPARRLGRWDRAVEATMHGGGVGRPPTGCAKSTGACGWRAILSQKLWAAVPASRGAIGLHHAAPG